MKRATVTVDLVLNQAAMVKTSPHLLELIIQNMEISCPVPPRLKVLSMITIMATKQNSKDRYMAMIMEEKIIPISRYKEFATIVNVKS